MRRSYCDTMKAVQKNSAFFLLLVLSLTTITNIQSFSTFSTASRRTFVIVGGDQQQQLYYNGLERHNPKNILLPPLSATSSSTTTETTTSSTISSISVDLSDVGFVLLAGGTGSRMKADMPKQFLPLLGKPMLHHSLELFLQTLPNLLGQDKAPQHVVLVMDPMYQPDYQHWVDQSNGKLQLASPGKERQGSVENGLDKLIEMSLGEATYVAVHDSARPLVTPEEICSVVKDAKDVGAAVLGVPCKATIKESNDGILVQRTIPRQRLWEVHTPQVIKIDTLKRGFEKALAENWEVTDDVSLVELLGEPVKLTLGEYTNLKVTTPEDLNVAEGILQSRQQ